MKKIYLLQGGGFIPQVFNINPLSQGVNVNLSPLIQTASMPVDSAVNPYIATQNLDISRQQQDMQRKEFENRIKQQDKENAYRDLQYLNGVRDDMMKLEYLPEDNEIISAKRNQLMPPELLESVKKGDKDAMVQWIRNSSIFMSDPDVINALMKKKYSDENTKRYVEAMKEYGEFVVNADAIFNQLSTGAAVEPPKVDTEAFKIAQQQERETKRIERESKATEAQARAREIGFKADGLEQQIIGIRENAKAQLGLQNIPDDQLTEEQDRMVKAKMYESEVQRALLGNEKIKAELEKIKADTQKLQIQGKISTIQSQMVDQVYQDPNLTSDQKIAKINSIVNPTSTVQHLSDPNTTTGTYSQTSKDGDRNYGNFVTDSDGVEIKSFRIGTNKSWVKKSDLPKSIKVDLRGNGEAYIILDGHTDENDKFLLDYYGHDIYDGINDDYNDVIESGPLKGSGAYNLDSSGWRIAIPIHDTKPTSPVVPPNKSSTQTPTAKKGVPSYLN